MDDKRDETVTDIVREMRALGRLDEKSTDKTPRSLQALGLLTYADRLDAALKRMADSVHRAMVIIAGIEMESADDPPRLWTALEDAYDALSDALETDGETTADVEEAKTTGRYFVVKPSGVKPSGNAAKMREALKETQSVIEKCMEILNRIPDGVEYDGLIDEVADELCDLRESHVKPALSSSPRNCDVGTVEEQLDRYGLSCQHECPTCENRFSCHTCGERYRMKCMVAWAQRPYVEGGAK